ncbi:MAG: DNA polymerase IV [Nitrospirota bacterium]
MRTILHFDMDAFFAAVEELRRPELRGKPLVVGGSGDPNTRGVVSTANYEARKYGIHSAMPLREAHRRCPWCIFLPVDYAEYSRISRDIMGILDEFGAVVEHVGVDEAFMDITGSALGAPIEIGLKLKARIKEISGLTASVGIGPNKLVAKIASDLDKPDGLTIITEEEMSARLAPLPANKIWGVGEVTYARLKEMGIMTLGDLANAPDTLLAGEFGERWGLCLKERAQGIDDSPLTTEWEPKSLSRETTFEKDTSDMLDIKREFVWMSEDLQYRLEKRTFKARTVTVKLRYNDFTTLTRARTLERPTDKKDVILKAGLGLLHKFPWELPIRLVGLRVSNFGTDCELAAPAELTLF